MERRAIHELVDMLPDAELPAVQRVLEYFAVSPAYRAAWSAQPDDEPVTDDDAAVIERTGKEVRAGKVVAHEDVLREFGLK
jgi:hypothetical protein